MQFVTYSSNTTAVASKRNLYLGFDPREGDITLQIQPSGLRFLDNLTDTEAYHLTIQVGNKGYPESIIFQSPGGKLVVEDKSQRINSHYFMNRHSAPAYLYDETPVTSIAFETAEHSPKGFIIWGRLINILQWRAEPFTANATLRMLPLPYGLCVKGEVAPQSRPGLYQVNTLCLQGYKQYLQLRLAQQRIANVLLLSAEQVEVLSAQGEDAYHHGIQLSNNVTRFAVTVIGNLRIMQGETHLFVIGENPDNTPEIRYTKTPGMPYQLALATLEPVVETLYQLNPQERHFTTPGIRYAWLAGEPAATLQIVGHYQGQLAQLLLEKDQATLSQPGFNHLARIVMVFH